MQRRISVLVVDDDEDIGLMIKMMLEFKGFAVTVLRTDESVEETIVENSIDIILLDMLIAGIKGTDICARLRSNPAFKNLPIIITTALPDAEKICRQAGANDFLAKPFEMDDLVSIVNSHVFPTGKAQE